MSNNSCNILKYIVNAKTLSPNTLFPPFLLTFEIFNYKVHNYLLDSSAYENVILLLVANKINTQWDKHDAGIIQLDISLLWAIGDLKNVLIHLSYDHRVHQWINIVVMGIPKSHGLLLSRHWSKKLQGYFVMD